MLHQHELINYQEAADLESGFETGHLDINSEEEIETWEYLSRIKMPLIFLFSLPIFYTLVTQVPLWTDSNNMHSNKTLEGLDKVHWGSYFLFAVSFIFTGWIVRPIVRFPSVQSCGLAFHNIFARLDCRRRDAGIINEDTDETTDVDMDDLRKAFDNANLTDESALLDVATQRPSYGTGGR